MAGCHLEELPLIVTSLYWTAARMKTDDVMKGTSSSKLLEEFAWEPLSRGRDLHKLCQFYKITKSLAPHYLIELLLKPHCGIAFLMRLGARNPSGRSNAKSAKLHKAGHSQKAAF